MEKPINTKVTNKEYSVRKRKNDIKNYLPSAENLVTSLSHTITNSSGWKEYSFEFFTSEHKAANIAFVALSASAEVKNIKMQ